MKKLVITALLLTTTLLSAQDLHVRGTRSLTPRTHIDLQGNYAFTTGSNNLSIIDVSDPQDPSITGQLAPGIGNLLSVSVAGDYAFCAGQASGLVVIDIHDPFRPAWVANRILTAPVLFASAYDTLIAAATAQAVYLLGASNPASINILDSYGRAASRVKIDGANMRIHCASLTGGFALDIDGSSLEFAEQYSSTPLTMVALAPPYVDYAQGAELHAIEEDSYNLAGTHNAQGLIAAVIGSSGYSFVGLSTGEIQYLNQQEDDPDLVASATVPSGITGLAVNPNTRILVASHMTGVTVLEFDGLSLPPESNPALPGELTLRAWPNPFNSETTFQLTVASPGEYTLSVTDILGRVVLEKQLTLVSSMQYPMDFSHLAAGCYYVRWASTTSSITTRIVYAR